MPPLATIAVPALVALIFKLVLLGYSATSRTKNSTTRLFLALLAVLALHNLDEILGFNYYVAEGLTATVSAFGYVYIALLIPAIALILHVSLRLSFDFPATDLRARLQPLLYIPAAVLIYLLLFTDQLVAGFQSFRNTVLHTPGPWYYLFEIYLAGYFLAALVNLAYGARPIRTSPICRARCQWWLLGIAPTLLLYIYLIVANRFGVAKLSSTIYVPIALTFFLIVATYTFATHPYRLFEIEFYIPWSKIRKRKTAFYARIQEAVAEIADLRSVREMLDRLANTLRCQVALIGGFRPIVAFVDGQNNSTEPVRVSNFPRDVLERVRNIVVANEIAGSEPGLYDLMKQYRIGAIVPFTSHTGTAGNWMLFGEHFSDNVYTPLDFKVIEVLLVRIGELFVDGLLLVRAQLADTKEELYHCRDRLAIAWHQSTMLKAEVQNLREELVRSRREAFRVFTRGTAPDLPPEVVSGKLTMQAYLERWQEYMVHAAMRLTNGDQHKAARILGIPDVRILQYLLEHHKIDPEIS